mmetsp:Transcript_44759/g.71599  ORF Transcript_44759/g.71599 Transcript_44759/m.71599 type:complete len:80 (+) Transcript_44759:390-629(+)
MPYKMSVAYGKRENFLEINAKIGYKYRRKSDSKQVVKCKLAHQFMQSRYAVLRVPGMHLIKIMSMKRQMLKYSRQKMKK